MPEKCWCGDESVYHCQDCGAAVCHIHSRHVIVPVNSTSWRQQTKKLCCNCFYFGRNPTRLPNREAVRA